MTTIKETQKNDNYNILLNDIQAYYPNFKTWFSDKVIPGLINNSREILTEYRDNRLVGIAIVKKESNEHKICTIKVIDEYKNRGIGIKLFKRSLLALNTNRPLVTVPEERFSEFHKIFTHFGFELTEIKENYYRKGKKEYIYNGSLEN